MTATKEQTVSELIYDIQELAAEMGDPFGLDAENIKIIARRLEVPAYIVQDALDADNILEIEQ